VARGGEVMARLRCVCGTELRLPRRVGEMVELSSLVHTPERCRDAVLLALDRERLELVKLLEGIKLLRAIVVHDDDHMHTDDLPGEKMEDGTCAEVMDTHIAQARKWLGMKSDEGKLSYLRRT
jgi:hypothetical protein